MNHWFLNKKALITLIILFVFSPLFYYLFWFWDRNIGSPEDFSFFGSYVSGTVGAIIQFVNFALLIFIYKSQSKDQAILTQQQYIAFVAPKINDEVTRRLSEIISLKELSLGFKTPKDINIDNRNTSLDDFLQTPNLLSEYSFSSGENLISIGNLTTLKTHLLQYTKHLAYVSNLVLELRENNAPSFIYQSYIEEVEQHLIGVHALNSNIRRYLAPPDYFEAIENNYELANNILKYRDLSHPQLGGL